MTDEKPGEPLRRFVRGFLHDHLGLSKIMAHHAADVFMDRWTKRDPETEKRYRLEDNHTREATFNRESIERADERLGLSKAQKVQYQKTKERGLLAFPDRPVVPTTVLVFDGSEPGGSFKSALDELRARGLAVEALKKKDPVASGDRETLEKELAELKAKNSAAPSWGAAVAARSERIVEIEGLLRR